MKHKIEPLFFSILFLILTFGIGIGTLHQITPNNLKTLLSSAAAITDIEPPLKEQLFKKDKLITFNGLVQKLMGRHLVGNEGFFMDSNGIMHLRQYEKSYDSFIQSTYSLAENLKERNIPFLICQTAERAAYGDAYSSYIDQTSLSYIQPLKDSLSETNAIYFDYVSILEEGNFNSKDIFFKTDIHYKTEAEFYIMSQIIETLEKKANLSFSKKEEILDLNNYSVEVYPFWGNLINSVGSIYVGKDDFAYFLPKFETSMHLENPTQSVERNGTFETVCLNGSRDSTLANERIYRVTDYMQWPSPYYKITNNLEEKYDILVIGCSMSMRTNAYLSLLCKSVTVIDPRYFNDRNYLQEALTSDYDAVILYPTTFLGEYEF